MSDATLERWWKPKATNLFTILYAVTLLTGLPLLRALALLVPSAVTILGIGSFGHLVNDWHDADSDAAVGKPNRLAGVDRSRRQVLIVGALALALLPWLLLPWDALSAGLLLLEFALLLAYVVPPVRLKERNVWPILADGAYAYAVPAMLAAHTFFLASGQPDDRAFLSAVLVWQLPLGVRHFLNHLALDRPNDLATHTRTLATQKGNRFLHRLIRRAVLPVELTGFVAFLFVLGAARWLLPLTFVLLLIGWASIHIVVTVGRRYPLAPYRFTSTTLDRLYQDVLPLVLLFFMTAVDPRFGLLLVAHFLLFSTGIGRSMTRGVLAWPLLVTMHAAPAAGVPRRRGRPEPAHPPRVNPPADGTRVPIAIVNINKFKYTETFVHGVIPRLRYRVYYLHGGELPQFDDADRHFLSNWPSVQSLARLLESLFRLERGYFVKNSVASYLQAREVRLILAHFGPVGVQMMPIARDLGVPLVVWFHGYDVFHGEMLRQCAAAYTSLFRHADRIVGVSELMLARLRELGAPEEKLVHLPAFVNLEVFEPADHSAIGPRFLAVGRFAETKSPHLTILAFERVARRVPEATLTMAGKGGGGELFEACMILARSLGLEAKVTFTGVLPHEQIAMEMRRARVFVQHSVTTPEHGDMEGKPVAVMEAMACGLPVVSTRHSGLVELIEDGVTGVLVAEYDVQAMADAMILLARNDDLVREIGRNASRRIHNDPLIANHVAVLDEILSSSIARNNGPVV